MVPAADRARRQRQLRMHDHPRRVEELGHAQAVAARAGADRRVERAAAAVPAPAARSRRPGNCISRRTADRLVPSVVHRQHHGHAVADFFQSRGLERFGEALGQVVAPVLKRSTTASIVCFWRSASGGTASISCSAPSTCTYRSPAPRAVARTPARARPCARAPPARAASSAARRSSGRRPARSPGRPSG